MSAELMSMTLNAAKYSQENRVDWYTVKCIIHNNKLTHFYFEFCVLSVIMEISFDFDIDYEDFENQCRRLTIKEFEKKQNEKKDEH